MNDRRINGTDEYLYYVSKEGYRGTYQYYEVLNLVTNSEDGVNGKGILELGRETIGLAGAQNSFMGATITNGSFTKGLLTTPANLSPEQRESLSQKIQSFFGGSNSGRVLVLPEDLKGKKIRVQQSQTNIRMMELLGGSATPMSFGEVYTAIQQKVIDGAENNELALTNNKHGEVAKYYSYNQHAMIPDILIMNAKLLDSLSEEHRNIILDAVDTINKFEVDAWEDKVNEAVEQAKEMGVEFYYPDIEPFKEKVLPLHDEMTTDKEVKALYDKIQAKAQKEKN